MCLGPDLTKTAMMMSMSQSPVHDIDRSASDSPNSSVSDSDRAARDSITSTQRLLPLHSTAGPAADHQHTRTDGRSVRQRGRGSHRSRDHAAASLPSDSLPDNDALVWSTVTSAGGRITLPGSGQLNSD